MRVTLLFFGQTADLAGTRRAEHTVAPGTTVGMAVETVEAKYPKLAGKKLIFALNEEYVAAEAVVNEGDELAIFTAVSGG